LYEEEHTEYLVGLQNKVYLSLEKAHAQKLVIDFKAQEAPPKPKVDISKAVVLRDYPLS